jgi:hypothetical protein
MRKVYMFKEQIREDTSESPRHRAANVARCATSLAHRSRIPEFISRAETCLHKTVFGPTLVDHPSTDRAEEPNAQVNAHVTDARGIPVAA